MYILHLVIQAEALENTIQEFNGHRSVKALRKLQVLYSST